MVNVTSTQPSRSIAKSLVRFFAFLGHGRMLETALVFVELQYAVMLTSTSMDGWVFHAFDDISSSGATSAAIRTPFWIAGMLGAIGLILNGRGYKQSRYFRVAGGTIGLTIWMWLLAKNMLLGNFASALNPWLLMAIVGSMVIITRGMQGLPRPGAPGAQ